MLLPKIAPQAVRRCPSLPFPVLGIDQSLTATGICLIVEGMAYIWTMDEPEGKGAQRLYGYRAEFTRIFAQYAPRLWGMEGYAFGSLSRAHALGELGGTVKLAGYTSGIAGFIAPPTTIKKALTGSGKSAKDMMVKEVYKHLGVDVADNNQADATVIAVIAAWKATTEAAPNADWREALTKIELLPAPTVRRRERAAA
jgi:Holliday junction resolvasome RuvABC endonuclease subunit